ncbi:MAG TPA: type II secretion system protein [Fimbriimonas sp.]|nr:type II secretion system protein [Fimbriimonas sp.]
MRRGFTIVEVLLTVMVAGLVSGVVFSMTAGVREKSRQRICASNMHAIFQGLTMYAADNPGPEQMPGLGEIKLLPMANLLSPYLPSHDVMYCPNTPPRLRKPKGYWSTYEVNFVAMPAAKDKQITAYYNTFKYDLANLGPKMALAICNMHDETYYGPREQDVDPDLAQPFQIRLLLDGSVAARRFAAKRQRTFTIN